MSNSIEPVLEVLELIFPPAGKDGADDEIKPKNWIPVAIRLCWLAAMKTCELSRNDQSRDLTVGIVEEKSGTETNGGEVHGSEHDAVKTMPQKNVEKGTLEIKEYGDAEWALESNRLRLHRASVKSLGRMKSTISELPWTEGKAWPKVSPC